VTGIDASAEMLEPARNRLGADAGLRVADLANPLPFPDHTFTTWSRPWYCTTWKTGTAAHELVFPEEFRAHPSPRFLSFLFFLLQAC
jgi:SAM-dependent methyltransferase